MYYECQVVQMFLSTLQPLKQREKKNPKQNTAIRSEKQSFQIPWNLENQRAHWNNFVPFIFLSMRCVYHQHVARPQRLLLFYSRQHAFKKYHSCFRAWFLILIFFTDFNAPLFIILPLGNDKVITNASLMQEFTHHTSTRFPVCLCVTGLSRCR